MVIPLTTCWTVTVGDGPVGGHDARGLVLQTAEKDVHASVDGLLADRLRGLGHGRHLLLRDVIHRVAGE
jgi:septal ring factor EnvC (AmiA/AmiB activator)